MIRFFLNCTQVSVDNSCLDNILRSIWSWSFPTSRYRTNVAIPVVIVTVIEVFELHTYELVRALRTPFLAAHLLESTEISSYIAQRCTAFSGLLFYMVPAVQECPEICVLVLEFSNVYVSNIY